MNPLLSSIDWPFLLVHLGTYLCFCISVILAMSLLIRRAPVLEDCRWCGALCDEGHTLCPRCRAKHDSKPTDKPLPQNPGASQ